MAGDHFTGANGNGRITPSFRFTRGFRDRLNEQLSLVAAAVSVAERCAVLLSRYDVDEAQDIVHGADGNPLPPIAA
eukprot:gene12184-biopygen4749